jgi:hypothetical protein
MNNETYRFQSRSVLSMMNDLPHHLPWHKGHPGIQNATSPLASIKKKELSYFQSKTKPMQMNIQTLQPLRWLAIILLSATLVIACKNKDTKTTEIKATEVKKDTLPALDKDSSSKPRPEPIKN